MDYGRNTRLKGGGFVAITVKKELFMLALVTEPNVRKAYEKVNISQIMVDENAPANARVQSVRTILEYAYKGIELEDIAERVDRLEDLYRNQ